MISGSEISAGISSLRLAYDIARGMKDVADATERNGKILELQGAIMDAQAGAIQAQQAHSADVQRIRDLEAEIAGLKAWDGEKQRYVLQSVGNGAFVYALKAGMENGEPPHWLCTNCYTRREKSFLQRTDTAGARPVERTWACPVCKGKVAIGYKRNPADPEGTRS
jgi:hypothetical protein